MSGTRVSALVLAADDDDFDENSSDDSFQNDLNVKLKSLNNPSMAPTQLTYRTAPTEIKSSMNGNREHGYTGGQSYTLPALQTRGHLDEADQLDPIYEDDPTSYDLVAPPSDATTQKEDYSLEKRSQQLFSREHLQVIFSNSSWLLKFTSFLGVHRPQAVPILIYYLDTLKSIRALHYANAIIEGLEQVQELEFTKTKVPPTRNEALEARATAAFDHLVREELPAFITYQYIQVVTASISARISGSLAPHLREASEGLAEVFCLTDPSRADNPIVFASEGKLVDGIVLVHHANT